jgi:hypothetical protein
MKHKDIKFSLHAHDKLQRDISGVEYAPVVAHGRSTGFPSYVFPLRIIFGAYKSSDCFSTHAFVCSFRCLSAKGLQRTAIPKLTEVFILVIMVQFRDRSASRLLAIQQGAPLDVPRVQLSPSANPPQWSSADHAGEATKLLAEERQIGDNFKDTSEKLKYRFKSMAKKEELNHAGKRDFSVSERCKVVEKLLENNSDVGLMEALLAYEEDNLLGDVSGLGSPTGPSASKLARHLCVCNAKSGKMPGAEDWVAIAVKNGNVHHIQLLGGRGASQDALDRGLGIALGTKAISNPIAYPVTEELIRYGADVNKHPELFIKAVGDGRVDIVEACMRGRRKLQQIYLNTALMVAEKNAAFDMVAILLAYGTDPNHQGAQAFLSSVGAGNLKMISLLVAGAQGECRYMLSIWILLLQSVLKGGIKGSSMISLTSYYVLEHLLVQNLLKNNFLGS